MKQENNNVERNFSHEKRVCEYIMRLYDKKTSETLQADAIANRRNSIKARLFGDEIWKFIISYRKMEWLGTVKGWRRFFLYPVIMIESIRFHRLSICCGYSIPLHCFKKGMSIAHRGQIVVNGNAKIGENCRIHEGVTIGTTGGTNDAPIIGNNVFIGTGAKVIGNIYIANDVAIGANAVVVKSIEEPGTTWAGNPAKKISDKNSHAMLSAALFKAEKKGDM